MPQKAAKTAINDRVPSGDRIPGRRRLGICLAQQKRTEALGICLAQYKTASSCCAESPAQNSYLADKGLNMTDSTSCTIQPSGLHTQVKGVNQAEASFRMVTADRQ